MIKQRLSKVLEEVVKKGVLPGKIESANWNTLLNVERTRSPEHGDFASGAALKLSSKTEQSPLKVAETILNQLADALTNLAEAQVAPPGFINFRLKKQLLQEVLQQIHQDGTFYGKSNMGVGKRVLIEYVSANPTGDLHIGHGRNGVFGSCLANLLRFTGYSVEEEFYVNDSGEQMRKLEKCAWALYLKLSGKDIEYPQDGYPEDTLLKFVQQIVAEHGESFLTLNNAQGEQSLGEFTKNIIIRSQRELLTKLGINFDFWFSEQGMHKTGKVDIALQSLSQRNMTYEADGALWLKARELGDERDRVLVKSGGNKTYLAPEVAYVLDKYERGYDSMVYIWGADHHGQVPSLKAVAKALGQDPDKLEVVLTQIVNLSSNGQMVRMSKRAGTVVLLSELLDEVGVDAVRYYLAESSPANPINFDLELAKKTSRDNPAFYIQYAHARCCAIFRKALEPVPNTSSKEVEVPAISHNQWQEFQEQYKSSSEIFAPLFEEDPEIFAQQKALIMRLDQFPEEIEEAAITRLPGRIARYAYELANDLQKFYEACRVITPNLEVTRARLGLIVAVKQVLTNALGIIGVSAPEKM